MELIKSLHVHGFYEPPAVLLLHITEGISRVDYLFYAKVHF